MLICVPYCATDAADSKESEEQESESDDSDDSDDSENIPLLRPDSKDPPKGPACLFLSFFCERTLLGIFASAYQCVPYCVAGAATGTPEELAGVHGTHRWRNRIYWLCSWTCTGEGGIAYPHSWEANQCMDATRMLNKYKVEHPQWITEYSQDCEDLLNSEAQLKLDHASYM